MPATPIQRPDYQLSDNLWATRGQVFMTGTQALVRLPLMQRQRDAAAGLDTQGFVSGYRGSPLGMVDQQIWKAGQRFSDAGIRFLPAVTMPTFACGAAMMSRSMRLTALKAATAARLSASRVSRRSDGRSGQR